MVAMKVVHPGRPGQAVGCETVSVDREIARMNMHKNARLMPQGRLLLVHRITDQGWTVGSAAGAAGLSERQAYRWLARYRAGGTAALVDRSSAPRHRPHQVPAARVAEIEHRRQRLSGPVIARQLAMPVSTVGSVLRRLGLGKLAALEPRPSVVRYQRERPGELIHIDTRKLARIAAVGHRITGDRRDTRRGAGREAVRDCIDDGLAPGLQRGVAGRAQDQRGAVPGARGRLVRAPGCHGRRVMTDNGPAYRSHHWRHACGGLELRHLRTSAHPLARPLQHRPAAHCPGPSAAGHPPLPIGVPRFDRWRRSSVPTCHRPRPVRRAGARSATGDRRQPARSVLAPARRTVHPRTGENPMLGHLNNVLGNDT